MILWLALLVCGGLSITEEVDSLEEFQHVLSIKEHVLAFVFDKEDCPECKGNVLQDFKKAARSTPAIENEVAFLYADMDLAPDIKEHYQISGAYALFLVIRGQMIPIKDYKIDPNFDVWSERESFFTTVLHRRFRLIDRKLSSMRQLNKMISTHPVIFLFLGHNKHFERLFHQIAEDNLHRTFFHVPFDHLQNQVFEHFTGKPLVSHNLICVLRESKLVTEFDPALVCENLKGVHQGQLFVDFESHPRLNKSLDGLVRRMIRKRLPFLFYLAKGPKDPKTNRFTGAVKLLPKKMIFGIDKLEGGRVANIHPDLKFLFKNAKQKPEAGKVYMAYALSKEEVFVDRLDLEVTRPAVIDFVHYFYERNSWLFETVEASIENHEKIEGDKHEEIKDQFRSAEEMGITSDEDEHKKEKNKKKAKKSKKSRKAEKTEETQQTAFIDSDL